MQVFVVMPENEWPKDLEAVRVYASRRLAIQACQGATGRTYSECTVIEEDRCSQGGSWIE